MKPYLKYLCNRCGITRGVKAWKFSEDGFEREVYLCEQCAEDTAVNDRVKEYKQRLKEKDNATT